MKTCSKCGLEKPVDEFIPHSRATDGRRKKCKDCTPKRKTPPVDHLSTTAPYSTERVCKVCKETVDWKAYAADLHMCKQCYHDLVVMKEVDIYAGTQPGKNSKKVTTWAEALAAMEKQAAKAPRNNLEEDAV